jgi:hypothetical protein
MNGSLFGTCHVFLRSGAAGEGMDRNSGAGQNCRADAATVCRADRSGGNRRGRLGGLVGGSFDRLARRRLTSLDKVNRDSMRRSRHGRSSHTSSSQSPDRAALHTFRRYRPMWRARWSKVIPPEFARFQIVAASSPSRRHQPEVPAAPGCIEPQPRVVRLNHEGGNPLPSDRVGVRVPLIQ